LESLRCISAPREKQHLLFFERRSESSAQAN
jgi:hypothetical protein